MRKLVSFLATLLVVSLAGLATAPAQSTFDTVKNRGTLIAGVRFDTPPYGTIDAAGKLKGNAGSTVQRSANLSSLRRVAPRGRVVEYPEYPQAFLALKQGLADAFVTDLLILDKFLKTDPSFEIVGPYLAPEPIAI